MSPPPDSTKPPSVKEYEAFNNRINVALARHKRVVQGWVEDMYKNAGISMPPEKSEEELDKEDAEFLNFWEPPHLGLGATIPKEYYNEKGELIRKEMTSLEKLATIPDLRPAVLRIQEKEKLLGGKAKASKEKTTVSKRVHRSDSSDEDEGRSALGKAKRSRTTPPSTLPVKQKSSSTAAEMLNPLEVQPFVTANTAEEDLDQMKDTGNGFTDESARRSYLSLEEPNIKKASITSTPEIEPSSPEIPTTNVNAHSQADRDAHLRREKNRMKKAKKKERKRLEKERQKLA